MVQSTFTKQKRELAKAASLLEKLRAQEVRKILFAADGVQRIEETKESFVDFAPETIFAEVMASVVKVVHEHGMRQQANSSNRGKFSFEGIEATLTVPQLRALQDVVPLLAELTQRLPRRNPKLIPNTTVDGRPAFEQRKMPVIKVETKYVPFTQKDTDRVRTYEEKHEVVEYYTQIVDVDFGLPIETVTKLQQLVADLSTAIQCAIDDANTRGQSPDPVLDDLIENIKQKFDSTIQK